MHKYIPRLHIVATAQNFHGDSQFFNDSIDHVNTFVFPETQFIAVTAYQNENVNFTADICQSKHPEDCLFQVTRLKIDHNPVRTKKSKKLFIAVSSSSPKAFVRTTVTPFASKRKRHPAREVFLLSFSRDPRSAKRQLDEDDEHRGFPRAGTKSAFRMLNVKADCSPV